MLEIASLCCAYGSFALFYATSSGSSAPGSSARTSSAPHSNAAWREWACARRVPLRLLAWIGAAAAWALWARVDGALAAALVTLVAFMVSASAFVILTPLSPRATWRAALVSPLVAAALVLGHWVSHG